MDGPRGSGVRQVNERPTFTAPLVGQAGPVPTRRTLLIGATAVGVVAATIGIGASIAGRDDRRSDAPPATTTAAPAAPPADEEPADEELAEEQAEAELEANAAVTRSEAEAIARERVAGPVDRARISDEDGTVAWEVRIDTDHGHTDVVVDATTGEVLEVDD